MADRLSDEGKGGEVQDAVKSLGDRVLDRPGVAQIALDETGLGGDGGAVAALEAVEDHHLVTRRQQLAGDDRADVAGASGDEQLHRGHLAWAGSPGIRTGDLTDLESNAP